VDEGFDLDVDRTGDGGHLVERAFAGEHDAAGPCALKKRAAAALEQDIWVEIWTGTP
jgi:hypothetical protein